MTLKETKSFFESKSKEATRKFHKRTYKGFAELCHILIDRPLTEIERNTIELELKGYRLKALEENTYAKK